MRRNARHSQAGLPGDWTVQPIRALGDVHGGSTPSRHVSRFWAGAIPWVTPGELTVLSAKYLSKTRECISEAGIASCGAKLLPKDTLLVTTRATLGAVALISTPTATNQGFKSIVFHDGSDPHFYFHLFHRLSPELARRASGTTFLEVSTREFGSIELPVPPLPEQRLIAEILDTVDLAIRKTEAMIAKLGQVKQGLLHDLLTRGIDDNGELRDPDRHPEQFKDSPLGRIPKAWEATLVGSVVRQIEQGWSPDCESYPASAGQWGVLRTTSVVWAGYQGAENKALPLALKPRPEYEVKPNDVLMTRAGPNSRVGVVAFVTATRSRLILSDKLYRLLPSHDVLPNFLVRALSGHHCQSHLSTLKTGLAESQTNISKAIVRKLLIPVPPLQEQWKIGDVLESQNARFEREHTCLDKLRLLKQGLMDDLLTGRVRVTSLLQEAAT